MTIKVFGVKGDNRLRRQDTYFQYKEEEQFTGEYWIDGKKIYSKVINTNVANTENELNALKVDTLIYFFGMAESNYNNVWQIPNKFNESGYDITFFFNGQATPRIFAIQFGSFFASTRSVNIIIKYTKTID